MILTCPACGTQYMVKDGAIPPQGRQVRCASCGNSWHQGPEADSELVGTAAAEPEPVEDAAPASDEPALPSGDSLSATDDTSADEAAVAAEAASAGYASAVAPPADPVIEAPVGAPLPPEDEVADTAVEPDHRVDEQSWGAADEDFSPFAQRGRAEPKRRTGLVALVVVLLLVAIAAAAIWFAAPAEWRERLGLASNAETPLQLMMTHSDRQTLASGNELLAVSGRVINPTDESQAVPPIHAELHSSSGQLVYSWTIPPPARTLPPGGSASFNSAELNVPSGGDELTITLGQPKA